MAAARNATKRVYVTEAEVETWRSNVDGLVGFYKLDTSGNVVVEVAQPNQTVNVTTRERALNSERITAENDVFRNGSFVPIRLLAHEEDLAELLEENPAIVTEDEMKELIHAQWKRCESRVAEISNVLVLHRMAALAEEDNAPVKNVTTIKARIDELTQRDALLNDNEADSIGK